MILAENDEQRSRALEKIIPMQRGDFVEILREMAGKPVTIRLLDPPLHEFLPKDDDEISKLAEKIGADPDRLTQVRDSLSSSTRCSGIAARAWGSAIRRFTEHRRGRFSRPRRNCVRKA